MKGFEYFSPTRIVFGEGSVREVANFLLDEVGHEEDRILIVTGKHSSKANGSLDVLKNVLNRKHLCIFDGVEENPGAQTVNKVANIARAEKIELVIGLGGGSAMDVAKCVALLARTDHSIQDYLGGNLKPTGAKRGATSLPIIAIPTTAGTGSEVTQHAVITWNFRKKGYSNSVLFPETAILDPELTLSMPYEITVNTGIDALTHAIEGYLSTRATPISDQLAIEAISIIRFALPEVVRDLKNIKLRARLLYASLLGGLVISQSHTIVLHALGYPLTTFYGIPHGRANGVLLPWVIDFLSSGEPASWLKERLSAIVKLFGGIDGLHKFLSTLGISPKLSNYGVTEEDIPGFVIDVLGRRNLLVTPRPVSEEDITNIYQQALY